MDVGKIEQLTENDGGLTLDELAAANESKFVDAEANTPQEPTIQAPAPSAELAAGLLLAAYENLDALRDTAPKEILRELSLAITKTEEAMLWFGRFQQLEQMIGRAEGNAPTAADSGLTVVEKPGLVVVGDPGQREQPASETATEEAS